jgi:hypothetical protein
MEFSCWKDHVRNCAPCHLPNVDGIVDPSLTVIQAGLRCMLCGSRGGATHMLVCDRCYRGWHMACMTPPMDVVPTGRWICLHCTLHSYDILGARMLWKPKEARILKNFKKIYRSTSVIW